jgi:quercetin 2,3-dioxygenase
MTMEYVTRYRQRSHIPSEPGKPYFIEKGMGDRALLFTDLFTIYAGAEQTEGTFNFFTCDAPKGDIIPTHSHPDTYEVFFVTSGAVRLFAEDLEGEQYDKLLTEGDFGFVPKNCPHSYKVERHRTQIVGVAAGPGGTFERFFENLGTPTEDLAVPAPKPYIPSPEQFGTVPQEFDVNFLPDHRWRNA